LPFTVDHINSIDSLDEPFILITFTAGMGQVPPTTRAFLNQYGHLLQGVASGGNRNWGPNFAKAANLISEEFNVPILLKFELAGTRQDIDLFLERTTGHEMARIK
jgi:protein involved in ribonucleotide reduction